MSIHYDRLGRNLRRIRKRRNITLEDFAKMIGLTPAHYGNIERGSRRAQLDLIDKACVALDVSYEEVLNGATSARLATNGEENSVADLLEEATVFMGIVEGCSPRTVAHILEACRCMASIERNEKPDE